MFQINRLETEALRPPAPCFITRREMLVTAGLTTALIAHGGRPTSAQTAELTQEEADNLQIVSDFIAAWNDRDVEKVVSFLADDARFTAGPVGEIGPLGPAAPVFQSFIPQTTSITMTVQPGSTTVHGPLVTHERVDQMRLSDGTTGGTGTWLAVFGLRDRQIVDFLDFQIA